MVMIAIDIVTVTDRSPARVFRPPLTESWKGNRARVGAETKSQRTRNDFGRVCVCLSVCLSVCVCVCACADGLLRVGGLGSR